jgi:cytosine deaminase
MNDLVLRRVRVGGRLVDLSCRAGAVVAIDEAGGGPPADTDLSLDGWLALAGPVEPHAHLDKALTADAVPNPAGDLAGALDAWSATGPSRSVEEITGRAEQAVRRMVLAGYSAVRTHVDCGPHVDLRAVDALVELRDRFAEVIEIQVCALVAPSSVGEGPGDALARLDRAIARGIDLVGGVPYVDSDRREATARLLDRAASAGLAVDFHTDETLDPGVMALADLAELAAGFPHAITASHCCSLGMADETRQAEVAAAVAEAGIGVVALPQTNLFLQSRGRPVAPPRGLTAVHALASAGVVVCAGADNLQDPFNAVGRADPFEVASLMVTAGHVDAERAWSMVTTDARAVMGLPTAGPDVGAVADLLLVPASGVRAAVADAPAGRVVVRGGAVLAHTTTDVRGHPLVVVDD